MKFSFGGGINELNDIAISNTEAISGQNFELGLGNTKFKPRAPFDLLAQTPNAGQINGIHQLIKRDNTKTTLIASGATMYNWDGGFQNNLLSFAEEFDNAGWVLSGTGTVTANTDNSPLATLTADTFDDTSTVITEARINQSISVADDTKNRTFSVYMKEGTAAQSAIQTVYSGGTAIVVSSTITWATHSLSVSGGDGATGALTDEGGGWYRISLTVANNGTGNTTCQSRIYAAGSSNSATGSVILWGALLNEGAIKEYQTIDVFTDVDTISATGEYHSFDWDLDQTILITDRTLSQVMLEWDGTTCSDLTHGLGVAFYAKYGLVANGRAILANVKTGTTEVPHLIAFSAFEDRQDFDTTNRSGSAGFTTGNEAFFMLSPDLKPINGLVKFKDLVIISTENGELFKLVGDDSTNYRWEDFYKGSAAVGDNSILNAGDDVYFMRAGGVIESLRATDTYGDVGTDDISLPIRTTVKDLTGFRGVYDQTRRKILFWTGTQVIVLYKDLLNSDQSPYSFYKTTHSSNFETTGVAYIELQGSTNKTVLFGDSSGNIYDLNGTGVGDAGTDDIKVQRKLPLQEFDYQTMLSGRAYYRRKDECDLNLQFDWGDENNTTNNTITLKGSTGGADAIYFGGLNYFGGVVYFAQGLISGGNPVSKGFSAIGKGSTVFVTMEITTSNDFELDYIEI